MKLIFTASYGCNIVAKLRKFSTCFCCNNWHEGTLIKSTRLFLYDYMVNIRTWFLNLEARIAIKSPAEGANGPIHQGFQGRSSHYRLPILCLYGVTLYSGLKSGSFIDPNAATSCITALQGGRGDGSCYSRQCSVWNILKTKYPRHTHTQASRSVPTICVKNSFYSTRQFARAVAYVFYR